MPKDGGSTVVLECRVKSQTTPTAQWFKAGEVVKNAGRFTYICVDEPENVHLFELEIKVKLISFHWP